jgi:hypothetical protein
MSEAGSGSPASSANGELTRVREWRWRRAGIYLGSFASPFAIWHLAAAVSHRELSPLLIGLEIAVLAAAVTFVCWMARWDGIREVRVSPAGVQFLLGRAIIDVPWQRLEPPRNRLFFGDIEFWFPKELGTRPQRSNSVRDYLYVTRKQAIAIVCHPSCPDWRLNPRILNSLRIHVRTGGLA